MRPFEVSGCPNGGEHDLPGFKLAAPEGVESIDLVEWSVAAGKDGCQRCQYVMRTAIEQTPKGIMLVSLAVLHWISQVALLRSVSAPGTVPDFAIEMFFPPGLLNKASTTFLSKLRLDSFDSAIFDGTVYGFPHLEGFVDLITDLGASGRCEVWDDAMDGLVGVYITRQSIN